MNSMNDTIAAISTPLGQGGIGIVRLSGRASLAIADRIFTPRTGAGPSACRSHTVHYGFVKVPGKDEIVDEALLTVMCSPQTYTTEDVVEINCHGGLMPLKRVLELCLKEGARLAEPGEFTKRAFLNGRMDLSQAEAVLDLINAQTDTSRKVALDQLRGSISGEIRGIRGSILDILSLIELTIDFSQEDVHFPERDNITGRVEEISRSLRRMLETSEKGMVLREGASVVICGRPNAGKSSLMNALLRHDRVIVTPVAGTTRDVIEEAIVISGVKVRLSDTAGIVETHDRVEIEGVKRSRERLACADVVIFMLDSSLPLSRKDKEIYNTIRDKRMVIVANKTDLPSALDMDEARRRFKRDDILGVSVLEKKGLEDIEDAVAAKLFSGSMGSLTEGPVITNLRHKRSLEKAAESIERALSVTGADYNAELLASDLKEAAHQLGLVIGESVEDDILDRIFSQFCIGK